MSILFPFYRWRNYDLQSLNCPLSRKWWGVSWNSNPRWPGVHGLLCSIFAGSFSSQPTPCLWYPLTPAFRFPVNKNWCTPKWYKPELLTPRRTPPKTVSFILFPLQHETKSNGMKNMTWQHHLYYNFSQKMNFILKTMPFMAKRLAYFCSIVNCENYPLVFRGLFVSQEFMSKYFYREANSKLGRLIHNKSKFDAKIVWSEITIDYKLPSVLTC